MICCDKIKNNYIVKNQNIFQKSNAFYQKKVYTM